jgi:hypothetical protein
LGKEAILSDVQREIKVFSTLRTWPQESVVHTVRNDKDGAS